MPSRNISLETNYIYHIYNRGIAKTRIFQEYKDKQRFLLTLRYYLKTDHTSSLSNYLQFTPELQQTYIQKQQSKANRVEVACYSLMPNHFHLQLLQIQNNGISEYLRLVQNSYTRFFNTKYERVGSLFQGPFKSVLVDSDKQNLQLSKYIHRNPFIAGIRDKHDLMSSIDTSLPEFVRPTAVSITNPKIILKYFKNYDDYLEFIFDNTSLELPIDKRID